MVLVNGIDLNDGNMDMGKMKSVLDADVENIRNAKATVEKMIEEKMLGTEADGTIGVRLADGQINYHDKMLIYGKEATTQIENSVPYYSVSKWSSNTKMLLLHFHAP